MTLKTYDPRQFDVIVAGRLMDGFGATSKVTIEPESAGFEDAVGVDGKVTRSRKHDRRATMTITLMQTSESNEILAALYEADRDAPNGEGVFSVRVVDKAGTSVFTGSKAWIMQDPNVELADTATEREWQIRIADYKPTHGSNPDD